MNHTEITNRIHFKKYIDEEQIMFIYDTTVKVLNFIPKRTQNCPKIKNDFKVTL